MQICEPLAENAGAFIACIGKLPLRIADAVTDWTIIIVGVLTAGAAILAVYVAHRKELQRDDRKASQRQVAFVQAILDELDGFRMVVDRTISAAMSAVADDAPVTEFFPVLQDYFAVFTANAATLGELDDNLLRRDIIRTYIEARTFVDALRQNNEYLRMQRDGVSAPTIRSKMLRDHDVRFQTSLGHLFDRANNWLVARNEPRSLPTITATIT